MKNQFTLILAFLFLTSIEGTAQNYFPPKIGEWEKKSAASVGLDEEKLKEAIDFAMANEYSGSVDLRQAILKGFEREPFHKILGPTKRRGGPAGLIIKDGYVIKEWGDASRVDMTFSVTKSYLSTIAGLALDNELIHDVHDRAADYVWDGTFTGEHNEQITWHHLLTQSSDWNGTLWGGKDWADRPPREGSLDDWQRRDFNAPGSVMEYNDVRVNVLAYSLLQVWRKPLPMVLKERIMDPIGASTTWRWYGYENSWTNVDGIKMQSVSGGGHSGGGLFISTYDHARFGLLFLNGGKWNGKELISEEWVRQVQRSSEANESYGYMWWLNKGERTMDGVDPDIYFAAGFGGNYIVVDQKSNMVIVTRWLEPSAMGNFLQIIDQAK